LQLASLHERAVSQLGVPKTGTNGDWPVTRTGDLKASKGEQKQRQTNGGDTQGYGAYGHEGFSLGGRTSGLLHKFHYACRDAVSVAQPVNAPARPMV
jgi:hypothetical protein